jgi:hypothetical protein
MAGQIRDKGCPKADYLKQPTDAVSFLESSSCFVHSNLFPLFLLYFSERTHWVLT